MIKEESVIHRQTEYQPFGPHRTVCLCHSWGSVVNVVTQEDAVVFPQGYKRSSHLMKVTREPQDILVLSD